MKIGMYSDSHFSLTSSIMREINGYKYSARLDCLVQSFEWMYKKFKSEKVDLIVDLGDLTDSDIIKSEEMSALSEALSFNYGVKEIHLLGNHERKSKTSKHNSVAFLKNLPNSTLIETPMVIGDITYLPYQKDYEDLELMGYSSRILISHNDIKGYRFGSSVMSVGLNADLVDQNFSFAFNGHYHNATKFQSIVMVGQLVGSSFSDVYSKKPGIIIFDTETCTIKRISNPHSVVFYSVGSTNLKGMIEELEKLQKDKRPKCITLSVSSDARDDARNYIDSHSERLGITSTIIKTHQTDDQHTFSEERVDIHKYADSVQALKAYMDRQDPESLPFSKTQMDGFITEYLT